MKEFYTYRCKIYSKISRGFLGNSKYFDEITFCRMPQKQTRLHLFKTLFINRT